MLLLKGYQSIALSTGKITIQWINQLPSTHVLDDDQVFDAKHNNITVEQLGPSGSIFTWYEPTDNPFEWRHPL